MSPSQKFWFKTLAGVLLSIALAASSVAAKELRPVTVEGIQPVSVSSVEEGTPEAPETGPATNRRLPPLDPGTFRSMKAQARAHPLAQAADVLASAPGPEALAAVSTSFVGLDRPSSANNGFVFFPPDTIVAKSVNHVLEGANSAVRLFDAVGNVIETRDLNTFFGASTSKGLLFDPKVYFDGNATSGRFYVVALQKKGSDSRIWLAVSRSPDPPDLSPANWCRYNINGKRNAGTSLSSWADYPGLGVGADALVISANQFRFSNNSFTFAIVRVLNKLIAANNGSSCPSIPLFTFQPSGVAGDASTFTLQPVQHYTSPSSFLPTTTNPAYLLSTVFGSSATYRVWQVRNVASGSPTLRVVNVIGSYDYGVQPDAPQSGSSLLLDTGDNRMTQAAGVGDAISGVHGSLCNINGGASESCVRFVRISVGQNGGGSLTAAINQEQTFGGGAGVFYFWPGIAVNGVEETAVAFHRSSGASYLSSYWTIKALASTTFEAASPITDGTCAQTLSNRTGDYIGAQTDPSDSNTFWLAGERATTINGSCQWQTQIIAVTP